MSAPPDTRTAVVIGAGIVGTACAYYLARRGVRTVVIDRSGIAQGATGLASGGIRSQFAWPLETSLTVRSRQLWRQFEADHSVDLGFRQVGYLSLAAEPAFAAELSRRLPDQRHQGVPVEMLDGAGVAGLLPGVRTDDLLAAAFTPQDGFGSPGDVTTQVAAAARAAGVEFRLYQDVADLEVSGASVTALRTAEGERVPCDLIVNAAGLGSPAVGAMVGLELPVTPFRQHQFLTEDIPDWDTTRLPNVLEPGRDLYLRGEGRGVLLGVSEPAEAGRSDTAVTWELLEVLGAALEHRWPRLVDAGITHGWVGCYEVTPDRRALMGRAPGVENCYYATGFSGHGFMHGFAAAEAIVSLALDGHWPGFDLDALTANRFAAARAGQARSRG